jgi:hypothetical protein
MAGHTKAVPDHGSARKILLDLQVEQHHHDEKYHREIARLSVHQRLNHMALHFAKYTGKIAASADPACLTPVYVDMLIIAISTANILNIELWDLLERSDREYPGLLAFGRSLAVDVAVENPADQSLLVRKTAIASGRIAAACEKIDHLEEVLFRAEIKEGLAQLSALSLAYISVQGVDAGHAIRQRLNDVKQRLKLHGRI